MSDKEVTVTLHSATRMTNSRFGNPRWKLFTSGGNYFTEADAAIGYEVDNHTNTRTDPWIGKEVVLTVNSRDRVIYWRLA